MTKKKQEELYDDSWLYILLLTTLSILLESLKTYKFQLMGVSISYAIILLPIVYLLVNYITKKFINLIDNLCYIIKNIYGYVSTRYVYKMLCI